MPKGRPGRGSKRTSATTSTSKSSQSPTKQVTGRSSSKTSAK